MGCRRHVLAKNAGVAVVLRTLGEGVFPASALFGLFGVEKQTGVFVRTSIIGRARAAQE